MNTAIQATSLSKSYDGKLALRDVSISLEPGRIVGLLGPNGSGKTTLLDLVAGLALPTSGSVSTLGVEAPDLEAAELARLGYAQQDMQLLGWLTVEDQLAFAASLYPRWDDARQRGLVERFALSLKKRVDALSAGDRQKLGIVLAVCHHPSLILLDEPANALDPIARETLLKLLFELVEEDGAAIVISSHLLSDVEKAIDRVWFLRDGALAADADLDSLKESFAAWTVEAGGARSLPERFAESFVLEQRGAGRRRELVVRDPERHLAEFESRHGVSVSSRHLNLESIYPLLAR